MAAVGAGVGGGVGGTVAGIVAGTVTGNSDDAGAPIVVDGGTVVGEGHGRRRREALLVAGDGVARVTTPDRPGDDPGDHDERQHGDDDEAAAVRAFAGVGLFVGLLCGGFGLHGLVHSTSSDRRSRTYLAPFN